MHSYMHTLMMRKRTGRPSSAQPGRRDRSARRDATTVAPQHGAAPGNGEAVARGKTRLTMYLDLAVVEHFRSRAGGRGYQTLINEALK
ncbi:MAG: BrnA antitoxin family protein, partial [Betaproteobacteria bacterium]